MEVTIDFRNRDELINVVGILDRNLRAIRKLTKANIRVMNNSIRISGTRKSVEKSQRMLERVRDTVGAGGEFTDEMLGQLLSEEPMAELAEGTYKSSALKRANIAPKTEGQAHYLEEIEHNDIVFCIGPAGTGKTFLAVSKAIEYLQAGRVRKIILVRPAVEAGERLGYLPGGIYEKINPYLRPVYDAINFFLEFGMLKKLMDNDIVEIVPLAFMRGRTLDESFIILDEGQNTTSEQMKMFLTRMGMKSKIVVTGDITQIDLPKHIGSGLVQAVHLLKGIPSISIVNLTRADIVRHKLVQVIVDKYEHMKPQ